MNLEKNSITERFFRPFSLSLFVLSHHDKMRIIFILERRDEKKALLFLLSLF